MRVVKGRIARVLEKSDVVEREETLLLVPPCLDLHAAAWLFLTKSRAPVVARHRERRRDGAAQRTLVLLRKHVVFRLFFPCTGRGVEKFLDLHRGPKADTRNLRELSCLGPLQLPHPVVPGPAKGLGALSPDVGHARDLEKVLFPEIASKAAFRPCRDDAPDRQWGPAGRTRLRPRSDGSTARGARRTDGPDDFPIGEPRS